MAENIGQFPFVVEPFSEDFAGRLSWGNLGNHLLRCASLHAGSHGFGFDDMQQNRHVWVLSRLVVELEQMPCTGEEYTIETWVSKIYRQFTDRLFAVSGKDGKIFGYAHSIWALIDMETRQPMDFSQLPEGGFAHAITPREVPIKGPGRVRVKQEQPVRTLQTYYSDLDINGHVNSIRYLEMILDLFSDEIYVQHRVVKRVEMSYCAESYHGDHLQFFVEPDGGDRKQVEIRKADGEVVVKAAIEWA